MSKTNLTFFSQVSKPIKDKPKPTKPPKNKVKSKDKSCFQLKCFCRDPKCRIKKIPRDVIEDVFHLKKKSDEFAESVIPVTYDFVKNHLKNITVEKCEEELDGEIF